MTKNEKLAAELIKTAKELLAGPREIKAKSSYRTYFEGLLEKWKVDSPAQIPDDKKDDFFDEVDKGWDAKDESD